MREAFAVRGESGARGRRDQVTGGQVEGRQARHRLGRSDGADEESGALTGEEGNGEEA